MLENRAGAGCGVLEHSARPPPAAHPTAALEPFEQPLRRRTSPSARVDHDRGGGHLVPSMDRRVDHRLHVAQSRRARFHTLSSSAVTRADRHRLEQSHAGRGPPRRGADRCPGGGLPPWPARRHHSARPASTPGRPPTHVGVSVSGPVWSTYTPPWTRANARRRISRLTSTSVSPRSSSCCRRPHRLGLEAAVPYPRAHASRRSDVGPPPRQRLWRAPGRLGACRS